MFTNWRGVLAPPGISDERRDELIAYLEEMHDSPEWQQALEDNGWIDAFKTGDEFDDLPGGAGRAGRVDTRRSWDSYEHDRHTTRQPRRGRRAAAGTSPQLGLAALLAVVGAFTIYDATTLEVGFADPVGPRVFPYVIGAVLIVLAGVLLVDRHAPRRPARGGGRRGRRPHRARRLGDRRSSWSAILVFTDRDHQRCSAGRSAGRSCSPARPGRSGSRTPIGTC